MIASFAQGLATAVFAVAAISDLWTRRIANSLVGLAALAWFLALVPASGTAAGAWAMGGPHLAAGGVAFVVLLPMFSLGWLGGGDVKLAAVVLLWAGPRLALSVLTLVAATGMLLALLMLALRPIGRLSRLPGPVRMLLDKLHVDQGVPYGVALALGGIAVAQGWLVVAASS